MPHASIQSSQLAYQKTLQPLHFFLKFPRLSQQWGSFTSQIFGHSGLYFQQKSTIARTV
jgi:hypothetical protein